MFSLVGLLVLVVAAVLIVPSFIDWSRYRVEVADRIGDLTGRPVTISGAVDLQLLPIPMLSAGDVRVANEDEAVHPDFLSVGALEIRIRPWPLLTGRVEVERVILVDPVLAIETLADGRPAFPDMTMQAFRQSTLAASTRLERMSVSNGTVIWRDGTTGHEERADSIFAQIAAQRLTGPTEFEGSLEVRGLPLRVVGSTDRMTPAAAVPIDVSLGIDELEGTVRLQGIASAVGGVQAEVEATGSDAAAWIARLTGRTVDLPGLRRPFDGTGRIDLTPGSYAIPRLSIDLGGNRIEGLIQIDPADPRSSEVSLSADSLALADFLPEEAAGDLAWLDRMLTEPTAGDLLAWGGSFDFSVDSLLVGNAAIREATLRGDLMAGRLTVDRLSGQLPGGGDMLATGGIVLAETAAPTADMTADIRFGDLRALLNWLSVSLPLDMPGDRLRTGSATFQIAGGPDAFTVSNATLALDAIDLRGAAAFANGPRPGLGLRVRAEAVDLDAYLPTSLRPDGAGAADGSAAWRSVWLWQRLQAVLSGLDLNLDLGVDAVDLDGTTVGPVAVDAVVRSDGTTVRRLAITLPDVADLSGSGSLGRLDRFDDVAFTVNAAISDLPALADRLSLETDLPLDRLGSGTVSGTVEGGGDTVIVDLTGATGPIDYFTLSGSIGQPGDAPALGMSVRLRAEDTAALLGLAWPSYDPADALGLTDLTARLAGTGDRLDIGDIQGVIGDRPVAADATLTLGTETRRPTLVLEARTNEVEPSRWFSAGWQSNRTLGRWPSARFDLSALGAVDGTISITANDLILGDTVIDDPTVALTLSEDGVAIDGITGRLFDGELGLTGVLEPNGATAGVPRFDGRIDLVRADLSDLLDTWTGSAGLDGLVDIGANVIASGASIASLIGSAEGDGLIAVRDGTMTGIDLAAAARVLQEAEEPQAFLSGLRAALEDGATDFDSLNVPFSLAAGVAQTDTLRLVGAFGEGEGTGTADLARWQIDLSTDVGFYAVPDAPALGLRVAGEMGNADLRAQTQALSAYFTQRAAEALSRRFREEGAGGTQPPAEDGPPADAAPGAGDTTAAPVPTD